MYFIQHMKHSCNVTHISNNKSFTTKNKMKKKAVPNTVKFYSISEQYWTRINKTGPTLALECWETKGNETSALVFCLWNPDGRTSNKKIKKPLCRHAGVNNKRMNKVNFQLNDEPQRKKNHEHQADNDRLLQTSSAYL